VFVVDTVVIGNPLSHGMRCVAWLIHSWRPWAGCSMSVFPRLEDVEHVVIKRTVIERSPAMRILVSAMDSIASEMALKDLLVVAMLILIITMVGVAHIGVMLMVAACILKTKSLKIKIMKKDLMMMKILSVKVAGLIGVIIAGLLILKKGNTIVVVVLMTTQITSLVSS
jgi:hypothetical protein